MGWLCGGEEASYERGLIKRSCKQRKNTRKLQTAVRRVQLKFKPYKFHMGNGEHQTMTDRTQPYHIGLLYVDLRVQMEVGVFSDQLLSLLFTNLPLLFIFCRRFSGEENLPTCNLRFGALENLYFIVKH